MVSDEHPRNHHHHLYSLLWSFWSRNSSVGINQESINQTRPSCDGGWDAGLTQSHIRMSIRPPTASVRCGAVFPWVFTRRNHEARDFSGFPRPLTTASINLLPTPRWCRECRDARLSCQDYGAYWFICDVESLSSSFISPLLFWFLLSFLYYIALKFSQSWRRNSF